MRPYCNSPPSPFPAHAIDRRLHHRPLHWASRTINKTAVGILGGAVGGYLLGDLVGGSHDRNAKVIGAGIGAIAGGAVGNYMDRQEAELRRQTAGTGVDVIRQGDDLILRMPSGITFPVDRYDIQPQFQGRWTRSRRRWRATTRPISTCSAIPIRPAADAYNQALSERRAQSVADYLASHGVRPRPDGASAAMANRRRSRPTPPSSGRAARTGGSKSRSSR